MVPVPLHHNRIDSVMIMIREEGIVNRNMGLLRARRWITGNDLKVGKAFELDSEKGFFKKF
jgi:hypothetical protein